MKNIKVKAAVCLIATAMLLEGCGKTDDRGKSSDTSTKQDDSLSELSNIRELSESDFKYTIEDNSVTITQFIFVGRGSEVSIPRTIEGKPVTTIGFRLVDKIGLGNVSEYGAFENCGSLMRVIIPDSVTRIDTNAFASNKELTSVTIPDSVTYIGNYVFHNCKKLTSMTIPDSVTYIGQYAFSDCENLTSMTIPDSVITIDDSAFACCQNLESMTIPEGVTYIGNFAFTLCENLTNVTIPDSVTEINKGVFFNCKSLTNITIPDSVTSIDISAFVKCEKIKATYKGNTYDYEHIMDLYEAINSNSERDDIDSSINSTDENNFGDNNNDSNNSNGNVTEDGNSNSDDNNASSNTSIGSNTGSSSSENNNVDNNFDNNTSGNNAGSDNYVVENTSVVHTHSYVDATCTEPKTCTVCGETAGSALGHTWEAVYSTVHHDQEGHYELVKTEDGYTWYHCLMCGEEFKSLDSYYSHFDSSHSESFLRDEYTHGSVYDQYDEIWVVDKEAYDETVIIEYRCSKCDATTQ